jgi:photosystem II stability/assembly factor-like uncharacterized protein
LTRHIHAGWLERVWSTNSGADWTPQTSPGSAPWNSIASSSDGTQLAAVVYGGKIWTSTNSGLTWSNNNNSTNQNWNSIASSSNGTQLAAVVYPGYIYISIDSGSVEVDSEIVGLKISLRDLE